MLPKLTTSASAKYRSWPALSFLVGGLSLCITNEPSHATGRASAVIDQITAYNSGLSSALRLEKYTEMSSSPLAFYRGTAHLYWSDLGTSALLSPFGGSTTLTFLQGDTHIDNFGAFGNSAGDIAYDLNDFDESVIGDYQLDLWRLTTSILLLARANGGFSTADEDAIVDACTGRYLSTLSSYVGNDGERTRVFTAANTYGLLNDFLRSVAAHDSRKKLLDKYTMIVGARRFDFGNPDLAAVPDATAKALRDAMPAYGATLSGGLSYSPGYFKVKSVAARLHAGLGSLGVQRYYLLIEGPSSSDNDDRILDVKAEREPSAFVHMDPAARSKTVAASAGDAAIRANLGRHALGCRVDDHAGELSALGMRFSVFERSPYKETFDTEELSTLTRITKLAEQWGAVLATAHARADNDYLAAIIPYSFEEQVLAQIGGRTSEFQARVRLVAKAYADQAQADYWTFADWFAAHPRP